LQIGQTVDYVGMTTTVDLNAYIVEGTGHTAAGVQNQIAQATIALNSQGVPVTFDATIRTISGSTTGGAPLSNVTANAAVAASSPQATVIGGGANVSLVGTQGGGINAVYTNSVTTGTGPNPNAISFESANTIVMSAGAGQTTLGHELEHQFGIPDQYADPSQLSYGRGDRTGTTISAADAAAMRAHIANEWTNPGGATSSSSGTGSPEWALKNR
jgi:hypothetical protein